MNRTRMGRAAWALAALVGLSAPAWAEDLVFVVSSEVSIEINKDLVKDVYWGRRLYWPKIGKQVKLCLRAPQSSLNNVLLRDFLMTSQQRYDRYWKSQMLAGRSSGMENLKDLDAVIDFTSRNPGSIAFMSVQEAERVVNPRIRKIRIAP